MHSTCSHAVMQSAALSLQHRTEMPCFLCCQLQNGGVQLLELQQHTMPLAAGGNVSLAEALIAWKDAVWSNFDEVVLQRRYFGWSEDTLEVSERKVRACVRAHACVCVCVCVCACVCVLGAEAHLGTVRLLAVAMLRSCTS